MRVNNFLMVLGELMQKMDSPDKQYGIALPAHQQYVNLIRITSALSKATDETTHLLSQKSRRTQLRCRTLRIYSLNRSMKRLKDIEL